MNNKVLAESFREIRKLLKLQGETNQFRLSAYDRAANQLELLGTQLDELFNSAAGEEGLRQHLENVPSIGDKSIAKIIELIQRGTCRELQELRERQPVVQDSFLTEEDSTPPKRKASKNLREEVTAQRRPWEQGKQVVDTVVPVIMRYFEIAEPCGSFRRKKSTVKDIDILCSKPRPEWVSSQIEELFLRIEKDLGVTENNTVKRGNGQVAFYQNSPNGEFHIDIWYVAEESVGAALTFATGPMQLNIAMRSYAKSKGLKLNRYHLARVSDNYVLASKTEEEIFAALGLPYLTPEQRESVNTDEYIGLVRRNAG